MSSVVAKIENNYFSDNALTEESWKYLTGLIAKSVNEEKDLWMDYFYDMMVMFHSYKYFTRKKKYLSGSDATNELKIKLKDYYAALIAVTDSKDFLERIYRLPNEIGFLILRYCIDISPTLKKVVVIEKEELEKTTKRLKKDRIKVAKEIDRITSHYETVFDFSLLFDLYNHGLFFEDNFINQGITEFIDKLLLNKPALKHLLETGIISKAEATSMKESLATFPSYNSFLRLKRVKECFTKEGEQVARRFNDYIEMLENPASGDYVIDLKSIFKEPYKSLINEMGDFDSEEEESSDEESGQGISIQGGGGGGGNFSNTADIDVPDIDTPSADGDFDSGGGDIPLDDTPDELPDDFGEEG